MEVLAFPTIHNFLICPKCDSSTWHISWPKDKELEWYVQCCECNQQYEQGLITGIKLNEKPTQDN